MSVKQAFGEVDRVVQNELIVESDRRLAIGAGATKVGQFVRPEGQISGYAPGQIVRFRFPSENIIDFREHALTFGAVCTSTQGATADNQATFPRDIRGLISRVVFKMNGQPVADEIRHNVFTAIESYRNDPDWETTQGRLLLGYNEAIADRIATSQDPAQRYAVQFKHGLLHQKVLPLKFMPELVVEVHLAQLADCVDANGSTDVNYTVNDLKLHYDVLNMGEDFDQFVLSKINSGNGMPILYNTYTHYEYSDLSGSQASWQIPVKVSAAQQLFHVFRRRDQIGSLAASNKLDTFHSINFQDFRVKLNNEYLPADRIEGFAEAWVALQDAWGLKPCDAARGATNYKTTSFILAQQLDPHRDDTTSTGVDIARGSSSLIAELTLSAAPGAPQVADNFVVHENLLLIKPGRASTFYQ